MAVSSSKIKENKKLVKLGCYMQVLLAHGNSLLVNVYTRTYTCSKER